MLFLGCGTCLKGINCVANTIGLKWVASETFLELFFGNVSKGRDGIEHKFRTVKELHHLVESASFSLIYVICCNFVLIWRHFDCCAASGAAVFVSHTGKISTTIPRALAIIMLCDTLVHSTFCRVAQIMPLRACSYEPGRVFIWEI